MQAYEVISPASAKKQMENFKDSNKQFYEQLSKGQVSNEDFERYIYGGSHNKKTQDERDKIEEKIINDIEDIKRP